jgi:hypothetical protein
VRLGVVLRCTLRRNFEAAGAEDRLFEALYGTTKDRVLMQTALAGRGRGREVCTVRPAPCIINLQMASKAQTPAVPQSQGFVYAALLLGWLVPGAGHLLTRHWVRALLIFVSITVMFFLGIGMQAKVYVPGTGDPLDLLGFVADIGSGILYGVARVFSLGQSTVQLVTADYGTKFVVVAGLLNFIAAVDAHNLRIGRKS